MTVKSMKEEGDRQYKDLDFYGAVQSYTQAINSTNEQDPDAYVCYSNRCAAYLQLNEFQKALYDANTCVRLKPNWPKGYNRKGNCLIRLNRLDEAYTAFEKTLELEPDNKEALTALEKLRLASQRQQSSSSSSQRTDGPRGNTSSSSSSSSSTNSVPSSFDWRTTLSTVTNYCTNAYYKLLAYWGTLDPSTQRNISIGVALLAAYYFFFYRPSTYDYYPQYNYSHSRSYGYGGGGLSWTMWAAIMFGAYKLPPMFPDLLGDYARPFFGMSWTTFMWLLNMMTRGGGGGMYMGGGNMFGGRRGGMFGRRY